MAKPIAYRYEAVFARQWDAPRPDWPLALLERVHAIDGVVDALFPDLTVAWHPPGQEGGARRESRRRVIEIVTSHAKQADADAARDRIVALVRDLADDVVVTRWPVELL